jgi:hypothetical protein
LHQLIHNYRSHSGILNLAASVVHVLYSLFPNSIDPLKRDQGMFPGPQPRLVLTQNTDDLVLAMTSHSGSSTKIDFGAKQESCIINVNSIEL